MRITVEHILDAPIADVWADVSILASHGEWMADADHVDIVSDIDRGVGTVMRVPTTVGPLSTEDWIIVTDWVEGSRIGVVHLGTVSGSGMFELEPRGDRTLFRWDEELSLPGVLGLFEPIAAPVIRAIWARNLERLGRRFD